MALAGMLMCISCQNTVEEPVDIPATSQKLEGVEEYRTALIQLSQTSESRNEDEDPSAEDILNLIEYSREFLLLNGISKEDLGIEDDEMLPIVAMSLLDYQKTMSPTSRTTAGGCVLEALGVREVVNSAGKGAAKYITKAVAKAVVKKAIPYIGWGWFAWDYIACVTE